MSMCLHFNSPANQANATKLATKLDIGCTSYRYAFGVEKPKVKVKRSNTIKITFGA